MRGHALVILFALLLTSLPGVAHAAEPSQTYVVGSDSTSNALSIGSESWYSYWTSGSSGCNSDGTAWISGPGVEDEPRERIWSVNAWLAQQAFDWADPHRTEENASANLTLCGRLSGGDPPLLGGCDISNAYGGTGTLHLYTADGERQIALRNVQWGRVYHDWNKIRWTVTGDTDDARTFSMSVSASYYSSALLGCGDSSSDDVRSMALSLQYSLTPKQPAQRLVIADPFPGEFDASTAAGKWTLTGPVNATRPTPYPWTALSLSGALTSTTSNCRDFRGASGSGTLTRTGDTNTYNLYNLVVDVGSGVSLYGQWITADGRKGRFGAVGQLADTWNCRVRLSDALLIEDDHSPQELVALLQETAPERPNTAPAMPQLVWPEEGHVFYPDEVQSFSVLTTDPEEDPYLGLIEVRQPGVSQYDAPWRTVVAPSGQVATGVSDEGPYAYQRGGPFYWRARASDLRLESAPTTTIRSFSVF